MALTLKDQLQGQSGPAIPLIRSSLQIQGMNSTAKAVALFVPPATWVRPPPSKKHQHWPSVRVACLVTDAPGMLELQEPQWTSSGLK